MNGSNVLMRQSGDKCFFTVLKAQESGGSNLTPTKVGGKSGTRQLPEEERGSTDDEEVIPATDYSASHGSQLTPAPPPVPRDSTSGSESYYFTPSAEKSGMVKTSFRVFKF